MAAQKGKEGLAMSGSAHREHEVIDLTTYPTKESSDHMEAVVKLLRSPSKPFCDGNPQTCVSSPPPGRIRTTDGSRSHFFPNTVICISSEDEDEKILQTSRRISGRRSTRRTFPFLNFPPEIRNSVYRALLTTPGRPIEFPKPLAFDERERAAKSRMSSKAKNKAAHKKLFLEILRTCHQVHDEATGIMYGCNVFKYRDNFREEGVRAIILPTCHLQLLKHIKVSVISSNPLNGQEERIAELIACFARDDIVLDTFELTWYGWERYILEWHGLVCQKLLVLKVAKQLTIHVNGEARVRKTTKSKVEETIRCRRIEFHRPNEKISWRELGNEEDMGFF